MFTFFAIRITLCDTYCKKVFTVHSKFQSLLHSSCPMIKPLNTLPNTVTAGFMRRYLANLNKA